MLPLKSSGNVQLCYSFSVGKRTRRKCHSLRLLRGHQNGINTCFGVKNLLMVQKVLLMTIDLPAANIIFCTMLVDRWVECLNEFGRYVEK